MSGSAVQLRCCSGRLIALIGLSALSVPAAAAGFTSNSPF